VRRAELAVGWIWESRLPVLAWEVDRVWESVALGSSLTWPTWVSQDLCASSCLARGCRQHVLLGDGGAPPLPSSSVVCHIRLRESTALLPGLLRNGPSAQVKELRDALLVHALLLRHSCSTPGHATIVVGHLRAASALLQCGSDWVLLWAASLLGFCHWSRAQDSLSFEVRAALQSGQHCFGDNVMVLA
jgi:hypothetical protein